MTSNQILAYNAKETARHNLATEEELTRSNKAKEKENYRHNVATEVNASETLALNRALGNQQNVINEQHYQRLDSESQRHNRAVEEETNRTNVAKEKLTAYSNATSRIEAGYQGIHVANEGSYWSQLADVQYRKLEYDAINAQSGAEQAAASSKQADVAQQRQTTYDSATNWSIAKEGAMLPYEQAESTSRTNYLLEQTKTEPVKRGTSVVNSASNFINAGANMGNMLINASKIFTQGGSSYAK